VITIDGSLGEGGGQILRTSLSLAALTGQDVRIENIRAGRDKPGLRPQHLAAVLAAAEICGAEVYGADVSSTSLTFKPHKIRGGSYEFDVAHIRASAGSVNLVLQTVIWPLAFADKPSRVTIKGGTHVPHAPTFDYIHEIFLPAIRQMGLGCGSEMVRAGYYPAGGGEVRLRVTPVQSLQGVDLTERGAPQRIALMSSVSNLPEGIADRQMATGLDRLRAMGRPISEHLRQYPSPGKGTLFFISYQAGGIKAGFQSIGEIGKRAEGVAAEACDEFEAYLASEMALDKHLADQLIIPVALADGSSKFTTCEMTQHLLTNIAVVERFLPARFKAIGDLGAPGLVERRPS
jgi:RNA 3'-terminal phosphate cyclase (ATP)